VVTHEAPVFPTSPLDSMGNADTGGTGDTGDTGDTDVADPIGAPSTAQTSGSAAGAGAGSVDRAVARLNVILAPETWSGIDDLAAREAALLRKIEELAARVDGDSIAVITIEVSPAIGALRLTQPDSLVALALASRLQAMEEVTSPDLDRREVRRHP